jgi:hypothetical protein
MSRSDDLTPAIRPERLKHEGTKITKAHEGLV